jgi:hypothetical protein
VRLLNTYIHYSILSISTSPACVVTWYHSLGIFGVVEYRHRHSAGRITPTSTSLNSQSRENSVIRYTLHRTKRLYPHIHLDYSAGRRRRSYTYPAGPTFRLQEYLSALDCILRTLSGRDYQTTTTRTDRRVVRTRDTANHPTDLAVKQILQ